MSAAAKKAAIINDKNKQESYIMSRFMEKMQNVIRRGLLAATAVVILGGAFGVKAYADSLPAVTLDMEHAGPGMVGWLAGEDGSWRYINFGQAIRGQWADIGGQWYLFDAEGRMLTGWQTVGDEAFYLSETTTDTHPMGACYMNETTPDGYQVNERGARTGSAGAAAVATANRPNPYGHSCVEVDIGNQMVYCYINDTLAVATPCVTGNRWAHPTSIGNFRINSKETNRYLQGYNSDGSRYKSWVNFWMPFNGGQGLHDAGWRSVFGGDIYMNGGSHGCVNMPYDAAAAIYSLAWVGMPVHTHW